MKSKLLSNITPGEILNEEFLRPLGITKYRLAKETGITPISITKIVKGEKAITPEIALKIGKFFDTSAEFWLNIQNSYDLRKARKNIDSKLKKIPKYSDMEYLTYNRNLTESKNTYNSV